MKRALVGWKYGSAILTVDEPPTVELGGLEMAAAEIWSTDSTPPDLHRSAPAVGGEWQLKPPPQGTVFRVVTFAPGATTGPHATQTLDYLAVIAGSICLIVGEAETLLERGDVIVLNGAPHDWINRSDSPCVIAAVLVAAE
ncbi:MAG TPA: cupin domain-containing protein [Solirubrobacteraceae bacterium]